MVTTLTSDESARPRSAAFSAARICFSGSPGYMLCPSGAYDAGTFHAIMACVLARPLFS